jgi:hypothetical protein
VGAATTSEVRLREVLAIITLWVPFVVVAITWLMWKDILPEDLPRQWDSSGVSSTAPTWLVVGIAAVASLAAAVGATFGLIRGAPENRRAICLGTGFVAGLAGGTWVALAAVTVTAPDMAEPDIGAWPMLSILSCGYGVIPFLLMGKWAHVEPELEPVDLELAPTEVGAWAKTMTVPLFGWIAAAAGIVALISTAVAVAGGAGGQSIILIAVPVLVALLGLAFTWLNITVDSRGLRVVSALLRIRIKSIPLAAIESAQTDFLDPLRWGGWGYRITPGGSAVILRHGPGLVVNLTNGRQFALSLTAPEVPTALLTALTATK